MSRNYVVKGKQRIILNGVASYDYDFHNLTKRKDGKYNVNYYIYNDIVKCRGLIKGLLLINDNLRDIYNNLLRNNLVLDFIESVDYINIFEIKYIRKGKEIAFFKTYTPINFETLLNDGGIDNE